MNSNKTVLILGKSKASLQAFSSRLAQIGYSGHAFTSTEKMQQVLQKKGPQIVCVLEEMGLEAILSILNFSETNSIHHPLILITGQKIPEYLPSLINQGLTGCLTPGFSDQDMKFVLERAEKIRNGNEDFSEPSLLYHEMYDNLQDGFVEIDLHGKILSCNKAYEKICGYSQDELKQMTLWDLTPEKWQTSEQERLTRDLFAKGISSSYEKEYLHKNGLIVPIKIFAYPVRNNKGEVTGAWAFVRDLSQLKKQEIENQTRRDLIVEQQKALVEFFHLSSENLIDSLQRLTALAAKVMKCERVSVWIFEQGQKVLACLDLYELGKDTHRREENLNSELFPNYFEALQKQHIISAKDARTYPATREFEQFYLIPKGITSMLDCSIMRQDELLGVISFEHTGPIRDWSPEEQNFAVSLADLVERLFEGDKRLKAEKNLHKSEKRYRHIFESSTIAIAELDFSHLSREFKQAKLNSLEEALQYLIEKPEFLAQLTRKVRVKDANPATLDFFEVGSVKEIRTLYDLLGEYRSKEDYRHLMDSLSKEKSFFEGETIITTKKGHSKNLFFHMNLPNWENYQSNVFLNMVDISSRIETEEILKRKLQEITALHGIALAGAQSSSVDELIERTTQLLGNTLFPDSFGVYIVDESKKTITPHPSYRGIPADTSKLSEPLQKGITGRAVMSGLPQRVPDVTKDKDYIPTSADTRSEIAVPIKINGKILGVVNAESTLMNSYSDADESFLVTFANQLALAIERMRLLEAQQRQTREVTALYETAVSISGVLDIEKLIQRLYLQISDLFPTDSFLLALSEEDTDEIHIIAAMQENRVVPEQIDQRFPKDGGGLLGWVIRNQQTLLVDDLKTDSLPVKQIHLGKPMRSWLGVPLISRGQLLGAIAIQSYEPHEYNENHARLLESMAALIATALENALLVEQTQNHIQRLSALHDIDLVINSSLDLRVTMNILLDQVIEKLKVDAASVMLLNPKSQFLEFAAGRGFRTRKIEEYRLRLGEGISGQAAIERHLIQSLNLSDLDENSAYPTLLSEEGFLSYYSVPLIAKGQVKGVLDIFNRSPLVPDQEWVNFLETLAGQAAIAIDNTSLLESLNRSNIELTLAYDTTLEGWSRALDLRDKETEGHTQRVVNLTLKIARELGVSESEIAHLRRGALLHDIGKMGIPDEILLKPGPLSAEEWVIMRKHPQLAFDLLNPIVYLRPALDIPYCHHERWDGSGYPRGLKGEQIPLGARIFSVIDVWDALTSDRPYRKAWPAAKALEYIQEQRGIQFDPKVVDLFFILVKKEPMNQ